eukprot:TRINITY_DN4596_c0_g1_i5.p1 TRINITY_DN4596_c0_g1~~TRINITY_DN4596_c0_g1_i5.p1  ORF type:complete len:448 (+),score=63.16 TRINITY_DN4596_c0_g1_i5:666-2009(+)
MWDYDAWKFLLPLPDLLVAVDEQQEWYDHGKLQQSVAGIQFQLQQQRKWHFSVCGSANSAHRSRVVTQQAVDNFEINCCGMSKLEMISLFSSANQPFHIPSADMPTQTVLGHVFTITGGLYRWVLQYAVDRNLPALVQQMTAFYVEHHDAYVAQHQTSADRYQQFLRYRFIERPNDTMMVSFIDVYEHGFFYRKHLVYPAVCAIAENVVRKEFFNGYFPQLQRLSSVPAPMRGPHFQELVIAFIQARQFKVEVIQAKQQAGSHKSRLLVFDVAGTMRFAQHSEIQPHLGDYHLLLLPTLVTYGAWDFFVIGPVVTNIVDRVIVVAQSALCSVSEYVKGNAILSSCTRVAKQNFADADTGVQRNQLEQVLDAIFGTVNKFFVDIVPLDKVRKELVVMYDDNGTKRRMNNVTFLWVTNKTQASVLASDRKYDNIVWTCEESLLAVEFPL